MANQVDHQLICNRYRLESVIADTLKTKIFSVLDGAGRKYAAKLTSVNEIEGAGSFKDEVEVFKSLTNRRISFGHRSNGKTPEGFPNVYFVGKHGSEYNVIVMDKLSPDLFYLCHHQNLSMRAYQRLGCDMLDRLKKLHQHGFVHRDVKPSNFMIDSRGMVHLIDFGISKRFCHARTNAHLPEKREPFVSGTLIYSSINAQNLATQSRRDDLESLGYSLIQMVKKRLPWEDAYNFGGDTATRVAYMKEKTTLRSLCTGLPTGIYEYMTTVSVMYYTECPDYNGLREMLRSR